VAAKRCHLFFLIKYDDIDNVSTLAGLLGILFQSDVIVGNERLSGNSSNTVGDSKAAYLYLLFNAPTGTVSNQHNDNYHQRKDNRAGGNHEPGLEAYFAGEPGHSIVSFDDC